MTAIPTTPAEMISAVLNAVQEPMAIVLILAVVFVFGPVLYNAFKR